MSISGFCASEESSAFAERFQVSAAAGRYRAAQNLKLSSIGLGTYLGGSDDGADRLLEGAIRMCLARGVNVIDSAINYRAQRSERSIGRVLADLVARKALKREEIFISTKAGFIPFDNEAPQDLIAYLEETYLRPGIIDPGEVIQGCHVMSPKYLEDQLSRSLRNLGLQTIDLYYLHNPETQLEELSRGEFYERLKRAFEWCEQKVSEGTIRMYGAATWNGFRNDKDKRDFLSLQDLWRLADETAGSRHHFRAIQLPYNLAMPEAFTNENQTHEGKVQSTLSLAKSFDLLVFTSASLLQGRLARGLPERVRTSLAGLASDAVCTLQFARSTSGVTTALCGMKHAAHVEENLSVLEIPALSEEEFQRAFIQK